MPTIPAVGQRVAHFKNGDLGTVCYVLPDRIGVAWDARPRGNRLAIFPMKRHEVTPHDGDVPDVAKRTLLWHRETRGWGI